MIFISRADRAARFRLFDQLSTIILSGNIGTLTKEEVGDWKYLVHFFAGEYREKKLKPWLKGGRYDQGFI